MGELLDAAKRLASLRNADDWETAVEDLLVDMARAVDTGVMLQADYTRKTQALAAERRQYDQLVACVRAPHGNA